MTLSSHFRRLGGRGKYGILPIGIGLNFFLNLIVARRVSVEDYGVFSVAITTATILALLATLGFGTTVVRFTAYYRHNNKLGLLKGFLTAGCIIIVCTSVVAWIGAVFFNRLFPLKGDVLLWIAALLFPLSVENFRQGAMRALHRFGDALLPRQVVTPFIVIGLISVAPVSSSDHVLLLMLLALVVCELVAITRAYHAHSFLSASGVEWDVRKWLTISIPVAAGVFIRQAITRWDLIILSAIAGMSSAGGYAAAARVALILGLFLRLVNIYIGPRLAESFHSGELTNFRAMLKRASWASALVCTPVYIIIMLYPSSLLGLFGPSYSNSAVLLQLLATAQFVNVVTGPVGLALILTKHEKDDLILTGLAAALSLGGLIFLVPQFSALGAAIATSFSIVLLNLCTAGRVIWLYGRSAA